MTSSKNFFKVIDEIREETNHIYNSLITSRQVKTLWNMWTLKTRIDDFKASAKSYLRWE